MRHYFLLPLLLLLAACTAILPPSPAAPVPATTQPGPTPTDCGCTVNGKANPTGGLNLAGPAGPSADTPTPAPLSSYRDRWETYTNTIYGFSFQYPAVYTSPSYGYCTVREQKNKPADALLVVDLGSRTTLTLTKDAGSDLPALVSAYEKDPAQKDTTFDQPKQRTVGGVPAVTLASHSGGTNRYSEATLFLKDGTLYTLQTGTPSACDVAAIGLKELDANTHVMDSFTFAK